MFIHLPWKLYELTDSVVK